MATAAKPLRVIQWATGAIGKCNILTCSQNPAFKLVGVYVHSADKHGKDAGEIAGIGAIGVKASNKIEDILALDADIVIYAPLLANVDEICRILESGKNLITPSGFTTVSNKADAAKLEAACKKGGVSFHGSGIHPGFSGDRLPLILSAMSRRIDKITVYEIVDMSLVNESWDMVKILGFDMTAEEARKNPPGLLQVLSTIFFESIALVAQGLGLEIDSYEKTHEFALAKNDIKVELDMGHKSGIVRKGHVAGQNFNYMGKVGGKTVIDFKTYWKMSKDLEPNWQHDDPWAYHIIIEGDPDLRLTFTCGKKDGSDSARLGLVCTAMNCMNTAPHIVNARPGIVTQIDLPMIRAINAFNPQK